MGVRRPRDTLRVSEKRKLSFYVFIYYLPRLTAIARTILYCVGTYCICQTNYLARVDLKRRLSTPETTVEKSRDKSSLNANHFLSEAVTATGFCLQVAGCLNGYG